MRSGEIDDAGFAASARQVTSPNCDDRPPGADISLLVVHNISLPPGEFGGADIESFFTNRLDCTTHPYYAGLKDLRVSAHFLIRRDGELVQFVPCSFRAWHAGISDWRGRARCNDFSIGVELEGADDVPYAAVQYLQLADITAQLIARYAIVDIVGHCDIAIGRKSDPGPSFDWSHYRAILPR